MGLKDVICTFCDEDNDIMVHVLIECPTVEFFWLKTEKWISHMCNNVYELDTLHKLFGDKVSSFQFAESKPFIYNVIQLCVAPLQFRLFMYRSLSLLCDTSYCRILKKTLLYGHK